MYRIEQSLMCSTFCTPLYFQVGKLDEINDIGENVDLLRENGILVDAEADPREVTKENGTDSGNR